MSPSTTKPQDSYRIHGTWTCFICQPNVHDRGGQHEFMRHYLREHYRAPGGETNQPS